MQSDKHIQSSPLNQMSSSHRSLNFSHIYFFFGTHAKKEKKKKTTHGQDFFFLPSYFGWPEIPVFHTTDCVPSQW